MAYKLEIKQEAKQDIVDGYFWYESKNKGLGLRFFREVEEIIGYIQSYPLHYQIRSSVYREAVMRVFPYVVVYEVINENVVVYAVFPTRNNPKKN